MKRPSIVALVLAIISGIGFPAAALLLFLAAQAHGQDSQMTIRQDPPSPVTTVSATFSGAQGGSLLYYWVVTRYPAGLALPSPPAVVSTNGRQNFASAGTSTTISWTGMPGATGYDVLFSDTPVFPAPVSCAACAAVLNNATTTYTDTGGAGLAWPPAIGQAGATTLTIGINNRSESLPFGTLLVNSTLYRLGAVTGTPTSGDCAQFTTGGAITATGLGCGAPLPSQTGNAGKFLKTDGSTVSWSVAGTQTGTRATIPAASTMDSQLYLPTDGYSLYRSNGTTFTTFGPIYPISLVNSDDWAWVNQGAATLSNNGGSIMIQATASGGQDAKILTRSAPATPYTITALVISGLNISNFGACGIGFRESGSGKLQVVGPVANSPRLDITSSKYNSPTSFSAAYATAVGAPRSNWWLRITDDGVNRVASWSPDGFNFITLNTVARTDFLTADQVLFYVDSNTSGQVQYCTLMSWTVQ